MAPKKQASRRNAKQPKKAARKSARKAGPITTTKAQSSRTKPLPQLHPSETCGHLIAAGRVCALPRGHHTFPERSSKYSAYHAVDVAADGVQLRQVDGESTYTSVPLAK